MRRKRSGWYSEQELQAMALLPSCRAPKLAAMLAPPFSSPLGPRLAPRERALLDQVLAMPDDDEPRQALADWYEEVGDWERAAFMRAQLRGEPAKPKRAWEAMFEPWSARHLVWRRGLVEGMSLAGRAFISLGAPLFRFTPLREVRLVAVAPFMDELAAAPQLACLEVLDLSGNQISAAGVHALAASPHLQKLHTLNLSHNQLQTFHSQLLESLRQRGIDVILEDDQLRRAA